MDVRILRYFAAVASERNFTRAAAKLGIAQPPLSRQIRELEAELQLRLIDRESRPVTLTAAGRLLLEHAHRVIGSMTQLDSAMTRVRHGDRRQFNIGFVGSTIYGPVPSLIRRFREAAPHADVDLIEMNTVSQIAALKEKRIDAGLGRLSFEDPSISRRVISHERLVAAIPNHHALALDVDPLSLTELAGETLIIYPSEPRPSYADQVLAIFRDYDLRPTAVREVRELQTALGLVSADAGLSVVPAAVQRLKRDDVVYRPIVEAGATSPIILSWRTNDSSALLKILLQILTSPEMQGSRPSGS